MAEIDLARVIKTAKELKSENETLKNKIEALEEENKSIQEEKEKTLKAIKERIEMLEEQQKKIIEEIVNMNESINTNLFNMHESIYTNLFNITVHFTDKLKAIEQKNSLENMASGKAVMRKFDYNESIVKQEKKRWSFFKKEKPSLLNYLLKADFSEEQRNEITKALTEDNIPEEKVWEFADPKYSAQGMRQARELLRSKNKDIKNTEIRDNTEYMDSEE